MSRLPRRRHRARGAGDDAGRGRRYAAARRLSRGMAETAAEVPAAIRLGMLRMIQHLYEARDDTGWAPPAAIAALWHPWRRVMLGGGR